MAHALQWFWTTGRHDPAWVQAVTNAALMVLTALTLVVLFFYALDNHRLAKSSVVTFRFLRLQDERTTLASVAAAYDLIFLTQRNLTSLLLAIKNDRLGAFKRPPMFPPNWPQLAGAIALTATDAMGPWMQLGILLRRLDSEIKDYYDATTEAEQQERYREVRKTLDEAIAGANKLVDALPEYDAALAPDTEPDYKEP
jgi:hypothetical protein